MIDVRLPSDSSLQGTCADDSHDLGSSDALPVGGGVHLVIQADAFGAAPLEVSGAMSYVVEVFRPVRAEEFLALAESDPELSVQEQGEGWLTVSWRKGGEEATFELAQGRISVTSPSDHAWAKACELAGQLGAEAVGEVEQAPLRSAPPGGGAAVRTLWLGWPVLVVVLAALLAWRW